MADLAETGMTRHDISLFGLDRFRGDLAAADSPGGQRYPRTVSGNGSARNNGKLRSFPQRAEVRPFW